MLTALALVVGAAQAGSLYPMDEPEPTGPSISITASPQRLIPEPSLDIGAEFRLSDRRGLRIGGITGMGGTPYRPELTMQVRDYVVGDFGNGIALGAEVRLTDPSLLKMSVSGGTFGPFMAMKVTASIFTVDVRGGFGLDIHNRQMQIMPLFGAGVGLSF